MRTLSLLTFCASAAYSEMTFLVPLFQPEMAQTQGREVPLLFPSEQMTVEESNISSANGTNLMVERIEKQMLDFIAKMKTDPSVLMNPSALGRATNLLQGQQQANSTKWSFWTDSVSEQVHNDYFAYSMMYKAYFIILARGFKSGGFLPDMKAVKKMWAKTWLNPPVPVEGREGREEGPEEANPPPKPPPTTPPPGLEKQQRWHSPEDKDGQTDERNSWDLQDPLIELEEDVSLERRPEHIQTHTRAPVRSHMSANKKPITLWHKSNLEEDAAADGASSMLQVQTSSEPKVASYFSNAALAKWFEGAAIGMDMWACFHMMLGSAKGLPAAQAKLATKTPSAYVVYAGYIAMYFWAGVQYWTDYLVLIAKHAPKDVKPEWLMWSKKFSLRCKSYAFFLWGVGLYYSLQDLGTVTKANLVAWVDTLINIRAQNLMMTKLSFDYMAEFKVPAASSLVEMAPALILEFASQLLTSGFIKANNQ